MPITEKLSQWFVPRGQYALLFYILSLPFFFGMTMSLQSLLPDALYYTPLTLTFGYVSFTPLVIVGVIGPLPLWSWYARRMANIRRMWANIIGIVMALLVLLLSCVGIVASFIFTGFGVGMYARFDVGHPYCHSDFLSRVERCEGRNLGFAQARLSAGAMYGPRADTIKQSLDSSEYQLKSVPCSTLVGGFGETCYMGAWPRQTGDTNFLNIYIHGDRVLVLKTENIPIVTSKKAGPAKVRLEELLTINRFAKDMGGHP